MLLLILGSKVVFLFGAILFSYSNTCNIYAGCAVDATKMTVMALCITGFVTLQWLI